MVSCSLMFSANCCFLSQFTIYWSTQGYNLGCIVCRTPVGLCGRIEYSVRCVAHMADWRLVPHIWKYWLLCSESSKSILLEHPQYSVSVHKPNTQSAEYYFILFSFISRTIYFSFHLFILYLKSSKEKRWL